MRLNRIRHLMMVALGVGICLCIKAKLDRDSPQEAARQAIARKDFGFYENEGCDVGVMECDLDPIAGSPTKSIPMRSDENRGGDYYGEYNHYIYCYLISHPSTPAQTRLIQHIKRLAAGLATKPPRILVQECLAGGAPVFFGSPQDPNDLPGLSEHETDRLHGACGDSPCNWLGYAVSLTDFVHFNEDYRYTDASPDEVQAMAAYNRGLFDALMTFYLPGGRSSTF